MRRKLYRRLEFINTKRFEATLYLFQDGRWELGLTFDTNGNPLFCINFIFIHFEFEFITK